MLIKILKIKSAYSTSVQLERRANDVKLESEIEKLLTAFVARKKIALVALGLIDKECGCKVDSHNTDFRGKFNGLTANTHLATNTVCLRSRLR